ncbi:SDR family oxidoreductase [Amycolatopsis sp. NPDC059235]|uniref:SDR family oxidoreductase n=1 Tax=Amycolatopsis sp. NPDC059235 TaxID=3346782 RepID=UPI00366DAD16
MTGATHGLGLAIARKLGRSGCRVFLNYAHDEDRARRAAAGIGGETRAVKADVGCPDQVAFLFDEVQSDAGKLDIFVHSAASFHPMPTLAFDEEKYSRDAAVALGPLVHGAGRMAEMLTAGTGRVVAVSSRGGRFVAPRYAGLGMAKAAMESLVRYLAAALAGRGVTVNAVAPGKLDEGPDPERAETIARLVARTPAGRLATAGDVADVVALLCLPEAAWIHGQVLAVDGGLGLMS